MARRIMEPLDEIELDAQRQDVPVFHEPMDEVEYAKKHPEYRMMQANPNDKFDWKCGIVISIGIFLLVAIIWFGTHIH